MVETSCCQVAVLGTNHKNLNTTKGSNTRGGLEYTDIWLCGSYTETGLCRNRALLLYSVWRTVVLEKG